MNVMRRVLFGFALLLCLTGCGDRPKDLYETGQFEEKQFNVRHAQELYQEILDKYPDSAYAALAAERLKAMLKEK